MKKAMLLIFLTSLTAYGKIVNENNDAYTSSTIDVNVNATVAGTSNTQLVITDSAGVPIGDSGITFSHTGLLSGKETTDIKEIILKAKRGDSFLTDENLKVGFDYNQDGQAPTPTKLLTSTDFNGNSDAISTTLSSKVNQELITVSSTLKTTTSIVDGNYSLKKPERLTVIYKKSWQ